MGRPHFDNQSFLDAARALAVDTGPGSVTIDSITHRLKAPKGSFYYRFDSRDAVLGELWLATILDFQKGFFEALDAGNGLGAALHMPAWARRHPDDARLLLLHHRRDFVSGKWPQHLRTGVKDQSDRLKDAFRTFARRAFGRATINNFRAAAYVLVEAPGAAVKEHIRRRTPPPPIVDELITKTFRAIVPNGAPLV